MNIPWKLALGLLAAVLVLYILLAFRTVPANAQVAGPADFLPEIIQTSLEENFQIDVDVVALGSVQGNFETAQLAFNRRQPFLIALASETAISSPDQIEAFPFEEFASGISENFFAERWNWEVVAISSQSFSDFGAAEAAYLIVSPNAKEVRGVLFEFSRIILEKPVEAAPPMLKRTPAKVLTLNILGRPAEQIEVCMRATCTPTSISACEVSGLISQSQWFAEILTTPETPFEANKHTSTRSCSAVMNYELEYFQGNFDLLLQFDWTRRMSGILTPVFSCDQGVSWQE